MEKVSIILPVYNAEKTVKNTIDSILKQTYKKYELIIINDGSTDNTNLICEKICKENKENIVYISSSNSGVSNARNLGISIAKGNYIMFIDSDDTYKENMLQEMVNTIRQDDYDIVVCGYERVNVNRKIVVEKNICELVMFDDFLCKEFIERLQENNLFNQIWNKIYKTSIIKTNNITFDNKLSLAEDLKFNLNYMKYVKKGFFVNKVLYLYQNTINGLNLQYRKDRLECNCNSYNTQKELYIEKNFSMEFLDKKYIKICISGLKNIVSNPDKTKRKKEVYEYIDNNNIKKELKTILRREKSIKNKLIIRILLMNNLIIIYFLAIILKKVDELYKIRKLGY